MCNNKFGEPDLASFTTPLWPNDFNWLSICANEEPGKSEKRRAATPETCGQAIEVPLMCLEAWSEACPADKIETPGA
jgi:hypothetical protein